MAASGRRVVHLTSVHQSDDVRILLKEARSLARAGYRVTLVAAGAVDGERDGVRIVGVPRARGRLARMTVTASQVWGVAFSLDADVFHLHDPELLLGALVAKQRGASVIYDAHEDVEADLRDREYLPRMFRRSIAGAVGLLEGFIASQLTAVIAATPSIERRFSPSQTWLVPNYPMLEELPAPAELRREVPRASRVAYVGAISTLRGAHHLVRAASRLRDRGISLILAGPFESEELEAEIRALPEWEAVDYLGILTRSRVRELLLTCRAGIVPFLPAANHVVSQPNKLFEYMAAGLPVVVSCFPEWERLVESVACGATYQPGDAHALVEAVSGVVSSEADVLAMGRRGAAAVRDRFNWGVSERQLLTCYEGVLAV